ncbi:unnamed protein product [Lepidochelys kempii]
MENRCCPRDQLELPGSPHNPDTEELLPLPLAIYPRETEDDPRTQVYLRGRVASSPGKPVKSLVENEPEPSFHDATHTGDVDGYIDGIPGAICILLLW